MKVKEFYKKLEGRIEKYPSVFKNWEAFTNLLDLCLNAKELVIANKEQQRLVEVLKQKEEKRKFTVALMRNDIKKKEED